MTRRLREMLAPSSIALGLLAALWGTFGAAARQDATAMILAFVVGAILIGLGAGISPSEPEEAAPEPPRRIPLFSFAAAATAGILLLVALRGFGGYAPGPRRAWALYVASLFFLVAAVWPFRARRRVAPRRVSRAELAALLAVLAVGATFRLHLIRSAPYGVWFDEAQNVLVAKAMLEHPDDRPVFVADLSQMPAMFFYYVAGFVKVVGVRLLAVRLATTAAGLLALVLVWALARELFDPWVGVAAAGLLAVSRWHVTFSRFGVANIFTTVFIPLALLLFVRSLKRASVLEAVLAGLAIGIGLQFYYALLTLPVIAVAFFAHRFVSKRERRGLFPVALLGLMLLAMLFTYAPVMQYARRHSEQFSQRMRTVSAIQAGSFGEMLGVFVKDTPRRAAAVDVLRRNTIKHAAMFHLVGDSNGRHNLPGAPMLDPVSGALFAVGFLFCLARLHDSRHALLLLWFGAMISAGILSLDFEAPQGARTFGATSVVALMGALPLAAAARWIAGDGRARARAFSAALLVAAFVGAAGFFSWRTFFDQQLWDGSAFAAFSAPETKIGEMVRAEGESSDVFVPAIFNGGPTESLLVGRPYSARSFDRSRDLPLSVKRGRSALVFFGGEERLTVDLLRKYYPSATIEPFGAPGKDGGPPGPTILWIARVPADQMERLRGWTIEVRPTSGSPRIVATSASEWSWKGLGERAAFRAVVRGTLRVPKDGAYSLVLE
ncbi:MAG TPA: glycosyltransferase family 39 protein, partial [Thermoanaerobaculia bacterium]|nr:glycosyltransferase family 39 protein [Thermoanaerobaculia bacterium]